MNLVSLSDIRSHSQPFFVCVLFRAAFFYKFCGRIVKKILTIVLDPETVDHRLWQKPVYLDHFVLLIQKFTYVTFIYIYVIGYCEG